MSAKPESLLREIAKIAQFSGHASGAQALAIAARQRGDFDGAVVYEELAGMWSPSPAQQLLLGAIVGYRPWVDVDTKPFEREVAEQLDYENRWGLEPPCGLLRDDLRKHARDLAELIQYPHAEHTS